MDFSVTLATDYERFAPLLFHDGFPQRIPKLFQTANHMNFVQVRAFRPAKFADMRVESLTNGRFPVILCSLEYGIRQETAFAVRDFYGATVFCAAFRFVRDRPCFSVLVLTNDFADTAFALVRYGFQATVLHEVAEIIQRMIIARKIIVIA